MDTTLQLDDGTALSITEAVENLLPSVEIRQRFATVLMQQIRISPQLQHCTRDSILAGVMHMAELGLDPAIPNECWLVPYKNIATFVIGYGGLRKLVLRSPDVLDVLVSAVHQRDEYTSGPNATVLPLHRRPPQFQLRGRAIGYYAAALLRAGHWRVIEMSREEIQAHRDRYSRAAQSTFWNEGKPDDEGLSNFDKMALKTVLRQLCSPRHLTLTAEIAQAVSQTDLYDREELRTIPDMRLLPPSDSEDVRHRGAQAINDLFGPSTAPVDISEQVRRVAPFQDALQDTAPPSLPADGHGLLLEDTAQAINENAEMLERVRAAMQSRGRDSAACAAYLDNLCIRLHVEKPELIVGQVLESLLVAIGTWPDVEASEDADASVHEDIPF